MALVEKQLELLSNKIKAAYEEGTTVDDAEKLAAEFLHAQIMVSTLLTSADLDARMKKSGSKAIRAAVYLENATKDSKKPSDVMLQAMVDQHDIVLEQQNLLDKAEVTREELSRYYDIFMNAHIHFRSVARGSFGG